MQKSYLFSYSVLDFNQLLAHIFKQFTLILLYTPLNLVFSALSYSGLLPGIDEK